MKNKDSLAGFLLGILLTCAAMLVACQESQSTPSAANNVMEMKLREEAVSPVSKDVILEEISTDQGPLMWRMYDRSTRTACYTAYTKEDPSKTAGVQWNCVRGVLTGAAASR